MNSFRPIRNVSFPLGACYAGYLFYNFYELYNNQIRHTHTTTIINQPVNTDIKHLNTAQEDLYDLVREFIHP